MTWALKRQIFYAVILIVFLLVFGFLIIGPNLNSVATCQDNKQNGNEIGIDCGGSCSRACNFQVDRVSILWARAFQVVPGRYNAVAYLENHNKNTAVNKISYRFRFADKNNVYIGKREGETFIPPSGKFAIFEPAIDFGHSVPIYTTFEFTQNPEWIQVSKEKMDQLQISVSNIVLDDEDTNPVLSATLKNNSLFTIPEVDVVVILYDANRNAVSASRTYLDELAGGENREIGFTWREPLSPQVISKEIIPMYNIFLVELK
ncbi:hypothetical protein A2727_01620 [Candidatus Nomurabacteria bacterium RIFCSPHIGHO2_01_FULL_37_110]|nr:MAG: hypothetical protein A2727_01620 [Candidatus Nomurabacteria bacterium RIFCSPHIGHO2_01_FULL_37_110]OGI84341.1 MAG: hypothetical protein A3A92_02085 [Candidatus Nomurabacteria bacterium RIFCSPLOWO2_01_FULL_37_49]